MFKYQMFNKLQIKPYTCLVSFFPFEENIQSLQMTNYDRSTLP